MKKFNECFLMAWYPIWTLILAMCAVTTGVYLFSVIKPLIIDGLDNSQWYNLVATYVWGTSYCMVILWITFKILWVRSLKYYRRMKSK